MLCNRTRRSPCRRGDLPGWLHSCRQKSQHWSRAGVR